MKKTPNWYEAGKNSVWHPYTQMQDMDEPIKVVSAKGSTIHLDDGRDLIDGTASWWSACHGYSHPHITDSVKKQIDQLPHFMFAGAANEPAYELCARLTKLTGLDRCFLTDSGSTAVETAMKMAVQYWKNKGDKRRNKFISFDNGYHGDTMGCMSLCDPHAGMHKAFNDYMPKQFSMRIPADEYDFSEFDAMLDGIQSEVAGVVIEPLVQGAGGLKFYSADVLAEIYRICKKYDLLFIADEVMTGFGRTGSMFACEEAAITPDIMCLGKALTGGYMTLAATVAKKEVFDAFLSDDMHNALMSGPTFMGNPLACSAANASLDLFEKEPRLAQVDKIEKQLYEQLRPLNKHSKVIDVRVKGAIGVVQIDTSWQEIFQLRRDFIKQGVWIRPFADVIYIMPAFTIRDDELENLTQVIAELLE